MSAMIGDKVQVQMGSSTYTGVLRDVATEDGERVGYVETWGTTIRDRVPMARIASLEGRTQAETAARYDAPVAVYAQWQTGVWSTRRFASIAAANAELRATKVALAPSLVRSSNDPVVTVGARTWTAIGWTI